MFEIPRIHSLSRFPAIFLSILLCFLGTLPLQAAERSPVPDEPPGWRSLRLGYNVVVADRVEDSAVQTLGVKYYLDWRTHRAPSQPNGMTFIQVVRLHQKLTCPLGSETAWNRQACPYAEPYAYDVWPEPEAIPDIARANPGALWLIGNEMDRRDWYLGGQDEMLPDLYAQAYHRLYDLIKDADATARVAIGGVVQPTPLRLQYLTIVWDTYRSLYGEPMPVDVWNVHNFILQERFQDYGADIPPGLPDDTEDGEVYESDWSHIDMEIFDRQIRAFRGWMQARGEQEKPLIVSEYGVLYNHCAEWKWIDSQWRCAKNFDDAEVVVDFMQQTFDYFLNTRDCDLGYQADGCRLVQQWLWFSLDQPPDAFNPHTRLYDPDTHTLTATGEAFRAYVSAQYEGLRQPIPTDDRLHVYLPFVVSAR